MYVELLRFALPHPELAGTLVRVAAKGVPDFVDREGPGYDDWLPPPVEFDPTQEYREWRAVLLVEGRSPMDGERFRDIFVSVTGAAWRHAHVEQVIHAVEDSLALGQMITIGWGHEASTRFDEDPTGPGGASPG